jgi:hypothetical protein
MIVIVNYTVPEESTAKNQTERSWGRASIYTIHTTRGSGLVPIDNVIACFRGATATDYPN